jgi:hypothetical protein
MAKRFDQLSPAGKAIVIGLFARRYNYAGQDAAGNNTTLPGETQQQYLARIANEWIVREAVAQRADEARAAAAAVAPVGDADVV